MLLQLLVPEPHFENHEFRQFLLSTFWGEQMSKLLCSSKMQKLIPESDPILMPNFGVKLCQSLKLIVLTQDG